MLQLFTYFKQLNNNYRNGVRYLLKAYTLVSYTLTIILSCIGKKCVATFRNRVRTFFGAQLYLKVGCALFVL